MLATLAAAWLFAQVPAAADAFAARFTGRTLRFDYHHCGDATHEQIAPDRYRLEGEWAGSRTQLVDDAATGGLGYGKYRFVVRDAADATPLFAQGFSSIYGEWETTGEAKTSWRAFHESQRFPEPKAPVTLHLEKRADDLSWREFWSGACDPASRFVDRSPVTARGGVMPIDVKGDSASKVDLLILGDGWTGRQRDDFLDDVHRLTSALFATEPFKRRRADFNVRAIMAPAPQPGITDPRGGTFVDTPLRLQFNAFDLDRYMLTFANLELRELAAQAPYDALIVLANTRKYGGGGIYNLWATCAADTEPAAYVFVHEFGHSFGGLADEYYSSQVAYEEFTPAGTEPWEPNITALLDPAQLKWRDLVAPGTPLPTPWDQQGYDALDLAYQKRRAEALAQNADDATNEALMREIKASGGAQLAKEPLFGQVGAFRGAGYEAQRLYRPSVDCIMFTRNPTAFCPVCERAIERVIDTLTK
ncbi:MAG: peptidase M64 [Planctomycetes bacterium]|nr:peptidase M64 [Planctomycetota bacterium]